ncbi:hypothetical protein XENOCAPTIV_027601 [Xenoophorus captivus]|uniref:Secreted protein n=1 Tax=Xenoophorus captivus TaxID=1517983 RepID=A0ABV0R2Z7_9TELE
MLTSVLISSLQPTRTTLAFGQNSCLSPCHCVIYPQRGRGSVLIPVAPFVQPYKDIFSPACLVAAAAVTSSSIAAERGNDDSYTLTFFTTLSRVSGRLMSKQMSTASESGYANGRTLS